MKVLQVVVWKEAVVCILKNQCLTFLFLHSIETRQKDGHKYEFEAKWIEVINKKGNNIIVGVNYRHPMKNDDKYVQNVYDKYLQKHMRKISKEKRWFR